jgi:hypothetical protein
MGSTTSSTMNAVLGSILENLQNIKIIEEPTVDAFKNDKENTGDAREYTIKQFVEAYFPENFFIRKGKIFSMNETSSSIDCVVLFPNHPRLITPKRQVIIAEGVFAAIELKPDISTLTEESELHRGLLQIQSVKKIDRKIGINVMARLAQEWKYNESHEKIPCVIFSFKSRLAHETITYIATCVAKGILNSFELPDLIVTSDNGIIFYTPCFSSSILSELKEQYATMHPEAGDPGERVFIHLQCPTQELTLAFFLFLLYKFPPPDVSPYSFILSNYFLKSLGAEIKFQIYPLPN